MNTVFSDRERDGVVPKNRFPFPSFSIISPPKLEYTKGVIDPLVVGSDAVQELVTSLVFITTFPEVLPCKDICPPIPDALDPMVRGCVGEKLLIPTFVPTLYIEDVEDRFCAEFQ